ncbi:DUF2867 domain-containing protein [Pseudoxanthomonas sp. z9]|uniref:DUF2867 domain-containing protein n=1 Tax=Pseudoxanthomonas sp. z9 TaxID=2584942 RepID=UPI001144BDAD|nr:DUF2867 domain-containing protein [Pseudoxanthomonas sp. z9]
MASPPEPVATFPHARIRSRTGGLPVEVFLIAQLGHGAGDRMYAEAAARQRAHPHFIDELDEPSTKLAGTDFDKGDATALYTFAVGPQGHPFHRHAGHRVFTAVTGSAGALLRFSTASDTQIAADPHSFIDALHHVRLPPDSLFTVRFGDGAWHQFAAPHAGSTHPVFFALSCHTDELGGPLPQAERERVLSGEANLASLTELLPDAVLALLEDMPPDTTTIPTVALAFDAAPGSSRQRLCARFRGVLGNLRGALSRWRHARGYIAGRGPRVSALAEPPPHSLLRGELADEFHHQDTFVLSVRGEGFMGLRASRVLADVLDGFLQHRPAGVSALMTLRNVLVRPLRLRTSPLGCPVSSLLSPQRDRLFLDRFPVLAQQVIQGDRLAEVVLGADDRHLVFRSCVGVRIVSDDRIDISLGTRVRCSNLFGHAYLTLIDRVHRNYVAPAMLRAAVEKAAERSEVLVASDGLFA